MNCMAPMAGHANHPKSNWTTFIHRPTTVIQGKYQQKHCFCW